MAKKARSAKTQKYFMIVLDADVRQSRLGAAVSLWFRSVSVASVGGDLIRLVMRQNC